MGRLASQVRALLWKNFLIKKRNKKQLFPELLMPIYFVALLAMIKALISPETMPPVPSFPSHRVLDQQVFPQPASHVLVSPDSPAVRAVMDMVASELNLTYSIYPSQATMEDVYLNNTASSSYGLVFNYDSGEVMDYALRVPFDSAPSTTIMFDVMTGGCRAADGLGDCMANRYVKSGFTALQLAINTAIIRTQTGKSRLPLPDVSVQLFPKPLYTPDTSYIQILSAIYFVIAYSPFINFLTVNLVMEKERRIKEGMRMMGLKDSAFWISWSLVYAVIILAVTAIVTGIAEVSKFFANSNAFIFFLMLFLYGLTIINLSFMMTPFFNKALSAGALASFASMAISLLYLVVSLTRTVTTTGDVDYTIPPAGRWALCLLSPVALALAIDQAIFLDVRHGGMNFSNLTYGTFPLYAPLVMLVVDTVLYGFLAIYFDNIVPSAFGQRRPPWYIFTLSYWCGKAEQSGETSHLITNDHQHYSSAHNDNDVEPVTPELLGKEGIRVVNLRKVFTGQDGDVVAVDDLTLDLYEGQITGLLGHNGAGKTTLINMLTGLTPASGGKGTVLGLNISDPNAMDEIRPRCGVCPQHNILFDRLTPREHLRLYAGIKAMTAAQMEPAIESSLEDVDLTDRGDTLASELSGGQKRKLSVAIALIGSPKVIILDEPTAGMDPFSRRHLWALLQSRKQGKIILLTTHFMDEADILADRKAIISKGSLRCCGSSLFLKNRFGIGYHLNMVVEPECRVKSVTDLVSSHVEGAAKSRSHGSELSYMLPMSQLSHFPGLFSALEDTTGNQTTAMTLGIRSFGVSMTTLEEVFLKLGEDDILADGKTEENGLTNGVNHSLETGDVTSENVTRQRFMALLKVRWLLVIRNRMALIFQLFLPVVFVVVGCLVNKYAVPGNSTAAPASLKMEKALGTYVSMKNVNNPVAAPVIVQDSTEGSGSVAVFKMALESVVTMREFDGSWDLLNATPHNMGINFTRLEAIMEGYDSSFTLLYNDTAIHSLPAGLDIFLNTLYGLLLGGPPQNPISTYNLPWNSTATQLQFSNSVFSAAILIAIAFVLIPAGFAVLIVRDRQWKTHSQLRVSGVTWGVYWGSLFTFNMLQYMVPAVLCVIVVLAAQVEALVSGGAILCLVILFLLYMPMNILLSYNFSFAFESFDTCQSVLPNFFLFYSMLPYVAVVLCDSMVRTNLAEILHYVFCVIDPPYLVFGGIYFIDRMHRIKVLSNTEIELPDYFKFENNIIFVFIMAVVHSLWLYVLLQVLEVKSNGGDPRDVFRRGRNKGANSKVVPEKNSDVIENEDSDVKAERQRVENLTNIQQSEAPVITIKNVRKEFKSREKSKEGRKGLCGREKKERVKVAVRNLTFTVGAGEVFGLLGPNGAGKTTTINMIIAEEGLTRGKIEVAGSNIRSSLSEAFQALGVCTQHDALWETITLREHLNCYAAIRGIPPKEIPTVVNGLIESLEVHDHADKHAIKLSGGTKRKLSYAMSMLGKPRVVLMDEPSTGLDPQSKRFLWDTISENFRGKDRGAILTTHYMEEADVLCSRVAIMVNGQLQCLGPTQHLKDKFGSGYVLEVKVMRGSEVTSGRSEVTGAEGRRSVEENISQLSRYVKELFPHAVCAETFGDRAQFKIPREDIVSLGKTFACLEEAKAKCDLAEYSFSQSTLEQVFLTFAKKQVDDAEVTSDIRAANNANVAEMAV